MPIPFFDPEDPPPARPCPRCGTQVLLSKHDLSCPCQRHYPDSRIVVGWICEDCNLVLELVGLFTSWADAISSFEQEVRRQRFRGPRFSS